ncbi:MAG: hypothetical protein U0L62_04265 [Paludibacteraceae bacterium]|nr:hypothetical protein [Paludibacteraceae bacterium]MEE0923601.1 hypothetical protein [Paludibacteraceae bacterium]MEE0951406.1 hypothetical protein [Paludibacteraceae bacterium]
MRKYYILLAVLVSIFGGCNAIDRKHQKGSVVVVNGQYLSYSTLDSLTLGLSSEDSIRVAQQYISQWAKDIVMYDEAKARTNPSIERLVEDYRRALYVHAYEEYLVEQQMPKTILDTTITQLYERISGQLLLDESIVKGLLVVYPNDAPKTQQLKRWAHQLADGSISAEEMDQIEKYAYQNANGYELFIERWFTTSDLLKFIPIEHSALENQISKQNQIEISDSTQTYLLQLTAKHLRGEKMPIDYATPKLKEIILTERQIEFLQKERERLYNEAIQNQNIVFYEK